MSSPLARTINRLVQPNIDTTKQTGSRGIILSYDYITKLASILVAHPVSHTPVEYHMVPVEDHNRGIETVTLKSGSPVWVSFIGNTKPVVTSILSEKQTKADLMVYYGPQINRYLGYM